MKLSFAFNIIEAINRSPQSHQNSQDLIKENNFLLKKIKSSTIIQTNHKKKNKRSNLHMNLIGVRHGTLLTLVRLFNSIKLKLLLVDKLHILVKTRKIFAIYQCIYYY